MAVVDSGCLRGRGEKIKKGTSCISPKEGQPPEHLSNTFVCFLSRGGTLGQPSRIVCNLSNHVFKLSTFNFFSFMKNCEYLQLKDYPLYDVSHHSLHKICLQHSFFLVNNESKWREKAFSCQKNKLSIHQQWNNRALTLQNALLSSCKHHCFCVCVCVSFVGHVRELMVIHNRDISIWHSDISRRRNIHGSTVSVSECELSL